MFKCLSHTGLLGEAGWFTGAYVAAAYCACSVHATYIDTLHEHACLFLFSFAAWRLVTSRQGSFAARGTGVSGFDVLRVSRMLFKWILLMGLLAALFRPAELDPTELLAFGAAILLLFACRCLLHFSQWQVRWRCSDALAAASGSFVPFPSQTLPAPGGVLCDHNAIRGSPA